MFTCHLRPLTTPIAFLLAACVLIGCKTDTVEEESQSTLPTKPVPVQAVEARLATLHPFVDLVGTLL